MDALTQGRHTWIMGALNTEETPVDNGCLKHTGDTWTMGALNTEETPVDNGCLKHKGNTCGQWVP